MSNNNYNIEDPRVDLLKPAALMAAEESRGYFMDG